jgi:hypothetical protein
MREELHPNFKGIHFRGESAWSRVFVKLSNECAEAFAYAVAKDHYRYVFAGSSLRMTLTGNW